MIIVGSTVSGGDLCVLEQDACDEVCTQVRAFGMTNTSRFVFLLVVFPPRYSLCIRSLHTAARAPSAPVSEQPQY